MNYLKEAEKELRGLLAAGDNEKVVKFVMGKLLESYNNGKAATSRNNGKTGNAPNDGMKDRGQK